MLVIQILRLHSYLQLDLIKPCLKESSRYLVHKGFNIRFGSMFIILNYTFFLYYKKSLQQQYTGDVNLRHRITYIYIEQSLIVNFF